MPDFSNRRTDYALYFLDRDDLRRILQAWPGSMRWTLKNGNASEYHRRGIDEYHKTAIRRSKAPAPIRQWLDGKRAVKPSGRILYYGCGRDEVGAKALERRGPVHRYDPYHPDLDTRVWPVAVQNGPYYEVHVHYVLNVCTPSDIHNVLRNIRDVLDTDGYVVISVRRDL
jgi:hypothetical protein